jgi:alpha-tubulin suppressor-like RCC1 family protein
MPKLTFAVPRKLIVPPPTETVNFIHAGSGFNYGLTSFGKGKTLGQNNMGQLGDNSITDRRSPVSLAGLNKTFCSIAGSAGFLQEGNGVAIDRYGKIWTWGQNNFGVLGINTTATASRRTPGSILGAVKTFCQIAGGSRGTNFALDQYGRAWTWGLNASGQIGDNSTTSRLTPVSVLGAVKTFCKISSGYQHSLAIDKNGRAWGWGNNGNGQLGNNITTQQLTPVSVLGAVKTFCQISGGFDHSAAIDKNGRAWAWGLNTGGQVGDNSVTSRRTPVSVLGAVKTFCKISCGGNQTFAIDKYGSLWSWGNNFVGQLGDNTIVNKCTPVLIGGSTKTFCDVKGSNSAALALDNNGSVWAWGISAFGEFGQGVVFPYTPTSIKGSSKTFCEIATENLFTLAITSGGRIWSWGSNTSGQLGNNTTTMVRTPVSVAGAVKTFSRITAGSDHSYAIDKSGRIWSWGLNNFGQLGTNSVTSTNTPQSILGAVKTFCKIAAGANHSLGIDKNGRAWSWGLNTNGQLGLNALTSRRTPASVLGAVKTFCEISGGSLHSLAIDKNGRVWSWGQNNTGQLGDNTINTRTTPVSLLGGVKTFCRVTAGSQFSGGLDKNGRAWFWGLNGSGQLGDNSITSRRTPVSVAGAAKTFCQISAGESHVAAIDKNGRVWTWGLNSSGQLGDNSYTSQRTPISVLGTAKTFCKVGGGSGHTVAIDKDGLVWAWGSYYTGQLGNNFNTQTPILILNL